MILAEGNKESKRYERFIDKIEISKSGCWLWRGAKVKGGYGKISVNGKYRIAHVYSFLIHGGTIKRGLQLDHLCRQTSCVNPDHLEPVTPRENKIRSLRIYTKEQIRQAYSLVRLKNNPKHGKISKNQIFTHCRNGHLYTDKNSYWNIKRKRRACRECNAASAARYKQRKA